jgi:dTDP-4-amino-4,6-dideoxygalactose transaminase
VNKIPPVDLARQHQLVQEEVEAAVLAILRSGYYIGGAAVADFEGQLADWVGVTDCVACNSGTDALYLALRALAIGKGDEVITSPFTFIATAEAITLVGATPVFVDIEPETFNLDAEQVAAAITDRTKAILPVHLFGLPANMGQLLSIAQTHGLYLIEDCAQATGARWQERQVGSIGHLGCLSFFPTKNLGGCGDGGAVTTNDSALATAIRTIKEHGSRTRYYHDVVGINSRLDTLQAAILQVKLRYLSTWNQQRREIAFGYHSLLQSLPGITLPQESPNCWHVWNQYTIRIADEGGEKSRRDLVREQLQQAGVMSMVYYPIPLHLQPVYRDLGYQLGQLPIAEQAAREVLSLPMFPDLTFEEQQQVAYRLKDCLL